MLSNQPPEICSFWSFLSTLGCYRSVRFVHSHVISRLSGISLNAFYYMLKTETYDYSIWNGFTLSKAVQAIPRPPKNQPLFFIDDTMVEKSGRHSRLCSKLDNLVAPNGLNYLNECCMVSLLFSFPIYQNWNLLYPSVPVGYLYGIKNNLVQFSK